MIHVKKSFFASCFLFSLLGTLYTKQLQAYDFPTAARLQKIKRRVNGNIQVGYIAFIPTVDIENEASRAKCNYKFPTVLKRLKVDYVDLMAYLPLTLAPGTLLVAPMLVFKFLPENLRNAIDAFKGRFPWASLIAIVILSIMGIITFWGPCYHYYIYSLTSPKQATPGAHHAGLRVVTRSGGRLSTKQAIARLALSFFFFPIFPANILFAAYNRNNQMMQDYMVVCYVVEIVSKELEEDTGKSQHGLIPGQSLIDFNRAGTPLIEIVTEPDIETAEEAYHFVANIRRIARHLGISNGHMEQGSLRCDVNVSVRQGEDAPLGQRVEVKNINSMRHVKMAIAYEIERQVALYEAGGKVIPETRSFDAVQQTTHHQRSKESQREYRYFPEPDLSPLEVDGAWIDRIKASMPLLPEELIAKFTKSYGLSAYDAQVLVEDKQMALYYEALCSHTSYYKAAANWLMGPIKSYLNSEKITIADYPLTAVQVAALATAVGEQQVSFSLASGQILPKLLEDPKRRVADLVAELATQEVGADRLRAWVEEVVAKYPARVKAYQGGQQGLLGFFVGQVLALSERKANPKEVKKLLLAKLG